ncbi:MAG: efflux RND transporter periplasmic adaptor subunit [Tannerellaceae bacterium]|jgi:membrane fusion protein (multidrug efflux system)|nr:efflux RND transporter periplasmic adaptor subunit [Tannerellaceae bacterium]
MKKNIRWGIIAVIVVFIVGMIVYPSLSKLIGGGDSAGGPSGPVAGDSPYRRPALNINAEVIGPHALTDKIITFGTAIPDEEVDLSFEASGKVMAIYFKEGTAVEKGELLAKINDKPLQAQLKKLEAEVPLARDRVYRQRALLEKDAVSQEAFEQVSTDFEKLMADIELVKANILLTELRAPFSGIVGLRSISEGAFATPSTQIVKLTKITPIKIEFSINETDASDVANGTPILFRLEKSDKGVHEYRAKVYAVESKMDLATRTMRVRATYPNENGEIQPGRSLSIEVSKREIPSAITAPSEAIIPEMGKNVVFLYSNGEAKYNEIITGLRTESRVQVLEGISEGDTIITTGVMQLRSGMKVTIGEIVETKDKVGVN